MTADTTPIDPAPIEAVLRRIPGVRDAAVFALPITAIDDLWIDDLWAALETDALIDEIIINAFCRKHLGPFTPSVLIQLRAFPRTETGTLQRDLLIAYAQDLNARLPDE